MMKNLIIATALMFSAFTFGQMSFNIENLDLQTPMGVDADANIGWFVSDDIMVSFGMTNWDDFNVGARYYTDFCDNMFVQATTNSGEVAGERTYTVGAAVGWTKALGIWKLQFEPMIVLDNIEDFDPHIAWGLRFNL